MGIELSGIGMKTNKRMIFTIRGCFRSICNHPFLVGNLCFLLLLRRYFPFIFSLLVSASPVLICTAILLGALLSFGQSIVPEVEVEEKTTHESESLKTGVSRDTVVIEHLVSEPVSSETRYAETHRAGVRSNAPEEKSLETESKDDEVWEDTLDEPKKYDEILDTANDDKSVADSFDSETVNVDSLNSPHSPWKHLGNEDEDDDDEEEEEGVVSDSGSDGGESSSPDASMADIMPMLDELHPLLDEDSSTPMVQISRNDSGVVSEQSSRPSTSSSSESYNDIENREELEVEDDDDDEDDRQGDKDLRLKSVIMWTDEDQKNLMDLGSSEIERNQRLENLILRRRRKNVSMVPEINLIDLENYDFPAHVASISTGRQNPFDLPNDSYGNIPGSAPSVLLQRRNPFEIPYEDSSQDKPDLINGDGFREDFTTFFKKHENFSVGPSIFAPNTVKMMRPYFVPERAVAEELRFSAFDRQSSEVSDSKASSIPETESVGSAEDLEDRKKLQEEEEEDEVIEEDPPLEDQKKLQEEEEEDEVIEEGPPEPQLISEMNHVAEIGHGSQSSSDEEYGELSESDLAEKSDIEPNDSCSEAVESGDMNITSASVLHKEPVYDSSPPEFRKNLSSSSSGSCDVHHHVESNTSLPPVVVKRTVSFLERDSENREIDKGVSSEDEHEVDIGVDDKNVGRSEEEKYLVIDKGKTVAPPSRFHDIAMHEPKFEHQVEEPVPNTPVESHEKMRLVQNLNIPEIYELDRDTQSSLNSPFGRDPVSITSSAGSHANMQTIHEEMDEIKEMDEGMSSSSDKDINEDLSVTQCKSLGEFEKHTTDSVEGETSRNTVDTDELVVTGETSCEGSGDGMLRVETSTVVGPIHGEPILDDGSIKKGIANEKRDKGGGKTGRLGSKETAKRKNKSSESSSSSSSSSESD